MVIVLAVQFSQEQQYHFKVQVNAKMEEWAVRLNENAKILSTLSQFASCETLWSLRTETKNMFLFRGQSTAPITSGITVIIIIITIIPLINLKVGSWTLSFGAVLQEGRTVMHFKQISVGACVAP